MQPAASILRGSFKTTSHSSQTSSNRIGQAPRLHAREALSPGTCSRVGHTGLIPADMADTPRLIPADTADTPGLIPAYTAYNERRNIVPSDH